MCKKEIVKKFNKITEDLLNDMKNIIGNNYARKFNLLIRFNSTFPIKKFKMNVLKFKPFILNKDPEYFKNENIILQEINSEPEYIKDKDYYMNEYYYLRYIYSQIDNESKENFWDILKVLIFLCESYHTK